MFLQKFYILAFICISVFGLYGTRAKRKSPTSALTRYLVRHAPYAIDPAFIERWQQRGGDLVTAQENAAKKCVEVPETTILLAKYIDAHIQFIECERDLCCCGRFTEKIYGGYPYSFRFLPTKVTCFIAQGAQLEKALSMALSWNGFTSINPLIRDLFLKHSAQTGLCFELFDSIFLIAYIRKNASKHAGNLRQQVYEKKWDNQRAEIAYAKISSAYEHAYKNYTPFNQTLADLGIN